MEEFQEADVLWPWPDTPPPPPSPEWGRYHPAAAPVDSSCEAFTFSDSEPAPAAASSSSSLTLSALPSSSESGWSYGDDGFFLSGPSTVSSALGIDAAAAEFLEADVLWPDNADYEDDEDDDMAGFWWYSRRVEETAAAESACGGKREEGRRGRPLVVSSPIDIPMATRAPAAARRRW